MNKVLVVVMFIAMFIACGDYHGTDYFHDFFVIQFIAAMVECGCVYALLRRVK